MAESREAGVHQGPAISLAGIGAGLAVIATGIALAVGVPRIFIAFAQAPASAPNDAAKPPIRGPVQETAPLLDIAAFRREKMRRLESSGIDPDTGRAHIPIERAMEMLARRGKAAPGGGTP